MCGVVRCSVGVMSGEAHIGEAIEMLRSILETRRKFLGAMHIATGQPSSVRPVII